MRLVLFDFSHSLPLNSSLEQPPTTQGYALPSYDGSIIPAVDWHALSITCAQLCRLPQPSKASTTRLGVEDYLLGRGGHMIDALPPAAKSAVHAAVDFSSPLGQDDDTHVPHHSSPCFPPAGSYPWRGGSGALLIAGEAEAYAKGPGWCYCFKNGRSHLARLNPCGRVSRKDKALLDSPRRDGADVMNVLFGFEMANGVKGWATDRRCELIWGGRRIGLDEGGMRLDGEAVEEERWMECLLTICEARRREWSEPTEQRDEDVVSTLWSGSSLGSLGVEDVQVGTEGLNGVTYDDEEVEVYVVEEPAKVDVEGRTVTLSKGDVYEVVGGRAIGTGRRGVEALKAWATELRRTAFIDDDSGEVTLS